MSDVLSVVTVLLAFAVLAGLVRLCDLLVGNGDEARGDRTAAETGRQPR